MLAPLWKLLALVMLRKKRLACYFVRRKILTKESNDLIRYFFMQAELVLLLLHSAFSVRMCADKLCCGHTIPPLAGRYALLCERP